MNMVGVFQTALGKAFETFAGLWPLLLSSVLIGVVLKLYVDQDLVANFLRRNQRNGVAMSTALAVGTPLCSCGTTALVLGMLASTVPWAPIVAFLVASPLTSPQEMIYGAGLFGWPFSIAFTVSSILLGLAGGGLAWVAESRGWLAGQARMQTASTVVLPVFQPVPLPTARPKVTGQMFRTEFMETGRKLLFMFFGFSFLGYFLNDFIPQEWIRSAFGQGNALSIPLAALLGIPFYLNTEASLPLVRTFMDSGMSQGAALAFLITGAGTSIGALGGLLSIARWRVVAIVVGTLTVGAVLLGSAYNVLIPVLG